MTLDYVRTAEYPIQRDIIVRTHSCTSVLTNALRLSTQKMRLQMSKDKDFYFGQNGRRQGYDRGKNLRSLWCKAL